MPYTLEEIPQVVQARLSGFLELTQASILVGIMFGGVQNLPKLLLEDTKNTGLIHITLASSFTLTPCAMFSLSLCTRFTNRRIAALCSLVFIFAYNCIVGFSTLVTREVIMNGLYIFSVTMGKVYDARARGRFSSGQRPYSVYISVYLAWWGCSPTRFSSGWWGCS